MRRHHRHPGVLKGATGQGEGGRRAQGGGADRELDEWQVDAVIRIGHTRAEAVRLTDVLRTAGFGMIYMMTGTLNIADMAVQLAAVGPNRTVLVALGVWMPVGRCKLEKKRAASRSIQPLCP